MSASEPAPPHAAPAPSIVEEYEAIPYDAAPIQQTWPDRLALIGRLAGLGPAPIERCRVLELGCASGVNLIAMAEALPAARFVGVDLSPSQIAAGQALARAVGLENVELRAVSILDLPLAPDPSLGEFDYVIAHGVYSWVPRAVQDRLLALAAAHLAPEGVAFVSYNVYPGWHQKEMMRDLLLFHTRGLTDPRARIARARELITVLARAMPEAETPYGRILRDQAEALRTRLDSYLLHEYLAPINSPVLFRDFVAHAAEHGLRYLRDAEMGATSVELPGELTRILDAAATEPVELGQYLDFLRNGTFRRSVLARADAPERPAPEPEALARAVWARSLARPESHKPSLAPGRAERFRGPMTTVTTDSPMLKGVLVALQKRWPWGMDLDELGEAVRRLGVAVPDAAALAPVVLAAYQRGTAALSLHRPRFVVTPGERPSVRPLARELARRGAPLGNVHHELVPLDGFDLLMMPLLDGTRDRAALVDAMAEELKRRGMVPQRKGKPVQDAAQVRAMVALSVDESLRKLADACLLVA